MVAQPPAFLSTLNLRPPPLEVLLEGRDSYPDETGKWTLMSRLGGKHAALLELWRDIWYSSPVETGISGNFLSCIKGVKDPFEAQ